MWGRQMRRDKGRGGRDGEGQRWGETKVGEAEMGEIKENRGGDRDQVDRQARAELLSPVCASEVWVVAGGTAQTRAGWGVGGSSDPG